MGNLFADFIRTITRRVGGSNGASVSATWSVIVGLPPEEVIRACLILLGDTNDWSLLTGII